MDTKICTKCGEPKALTQYNKARSACKTCIRAYTRKWHAAHPEKATAYTRKWQAANSEKAKAYNRTYQAAKYKKVKAYDRLKEYILSLGISLGTHEPTNVE